jgi:putative transposase
MPNHVHLLVESSAHPLAKFMQGLQQSYTQYFNKRHKKTGHLFEGRYKAIVCQEDRYLLELIRYIHLNPVRAGMVKAPEQYAHTGHHAYVGGKVTEIVNAAKVLNMLGGSRGYRRFIQDGIQGGHQEEYYAVVDQRFLGDQDFTEAMWAEEEEPTPRAKGKGGIEAEAKKLVKRLDIDLSVLRGADRSWVVSKARKQVGYVLVRRAGYRLKDVAAYLGRDAATLATQFARMNNELESDVQMKREIDRLVKIIHN